MDWIKPLWMVIVCFCFYLAGCGSDPAPGASHADSAAPTVARTPNENSGTQASADYALELARNLADTWIETYQPRQNAWSWDAGVLMMGLMDLHEVTGDARYYQYARAWVDYYIENGYFITSSDNSIPGYTALRLYETESDPKYLTVADDVWHYISEVAGRTSEGGLNHLGLISGNQIWVDSLFMIGPF
ncbi:MAG: glycoside hydrolase family 88 protein, partial [Ketobacteraceae bacterium]|nr:glycoside hydrolase family 88 protein [Ketobacteraceae bacterium]